jgi:hypothetical protein
LLKTRKRWVALLTAVVMIAALMVPFAGTASASTSYGLSFPAAVSAGATTTFTTEYLTVTMDNVSAQHLAGSQVVLELPSSPSNYGMVLDGVSSATGAAGILASIPASGAISNVSAQVYTGPAGTTGFASYTILVTGVTPVLNYSASETTFSIQINSLYVPGGVNGSVALTAAAPGGSMFASGSLTLATAGTGSVTVAAESVQSIAAGSNGLTPVTIDITESMAGSLANSGGTALKLTLPPGITWATGTTLLPAPVWGTWGPSFGQVGPTVANTYLSYTSNGGRELDISVPATTAYESSIAVFDKLIGYLTVDQSTAKQGDVVVTVSGSSTYSPSTLTVANYGTYAVSTKVTSTPTITAGMEGSTIGTFQIVEGLPNSIINSRTIDLTLPTNVAWTEVPQVDSANSTLNGANVAWASVGSTGNEIEGTITNYAANSTTSAVIAFKNAEVTPAVDFTGDLNVTVGGTEGLTGTIKLGTVGAGVTAVTSATPDVAIGTASAAVGDLTITEVASDNIQSLAEYSGLDETSLGIGDNPYTNSSGASTGGSRYFVATTSQSGTAEIDVWAPTGVTFFNTPTVTVTAGDLQVGTISTNTVGNQGELVIDVKSTSTTASTIKVTGAQVTIDRTVPEGPITFKVKGTGVDETELRTGAPADIAALFPNDTTAASANVANCSTGLNGQTTGTSVFKIGATSYTLNGNTVSMDVAPYIKDSRTFLPLRYVANALGVVDSNIMWDAASQKVTIIKGSLVAQLTIGSTTMLLNGATITMDTAPEITSGRTCLPVAWVAEALNAQIAWDATAQTVTITSN